MPIDQIYNRHDPAKRYNRHQFRADRVLQSAELNEVQSNVFSRIRSIGDVLFKEGGIVRQAGIVVNPDTGKTQCESGAIYLDGAVRGVPPGEITVATTGVVHVGVYLTRHTVSELDDPDLRNPAVGTRGYQEAGALRERIDIAWGFRGDGQPGEFYPVWTVEDGWVRPKEPPPNLDAVTQALARYDRNSAGGSYIVNGLVLTMLPDLPTGEQVYSLSQGIAHVGGQAVEQPTARRIVYNASANLRRVDSEPHTSSTEGEQRVTLDLQPMVGQPEVRIVARRTVQVIHGGHTGAADPLPDTSVLKVESVSQGHTTYAANTDYKLTAGQIDWSPEGQEPTPGSTYNVTYQYLKLAEASAVDPRGFTVAGALEGQLITVTYDHALRRIDRLCLTADGDAVWVQGVPAVWQPVPPEVPQGMLLLASVYQSWDADRRVQLDGTRVVPMQELVDYGRQLARMREDQAEIRLAVDIAGRHSGIKKGLFADPMLGNGLRDAGQEQTAAITAGALRLPMQIAVHELAKNIAAPQVPAHTNAAVLSQPARTGQMLVNPYRAFDPLPRAVELSPPVDRWTQVNTEWADPLTERIAARNWQGAGTSRDEERTLSEQREQLPMLRATVVTFTLHFGAGEALASCTFGGVPITPQPLPGGTLTADGQGVLRGTFTVPETLPAGTHRVEFRGSGGSFGDAMFTGQGELVQRRAVMVRLVKHDPLAQTFTMARARQCTGVRLWFAAKGTSQVMVQVREVDAGFPSQRVLAETHVKPADMQLDGPTDVLWPPVVLEADREYAIVILCDDDKAALAVAELGEWDVTAQRWVTSQPYQVGVLLSSSNASTWTAHQDKDLTFELLAAEYTETERLIDLGSVEVADATDLMVQAAVHQPAIGAAGTFVLTITGHETLEVAPGQVAQLKERYTGTVAVQARLKGSGAAGGMAAMLEPGVQLVAGSLQAQGTYITPWIHAGGTARVRAVFEALMPAGSGVQVHAQAEGSSNWVEVPYQSSSPQTAGVFELAHELASISGQRVRLRLTLSGSHNARPEVRNLRGVTL